MTQETIHFFFIAARHYPAPDGEEDGPIDTSRDIPARFPLYTGRYSSVTVARWHPCLCVELPIVFLRQRRCDSSSTQIRWYARRRAQSRLMFSMVCRGCVPSRLFYDPTDWTFLTPSLVPPRSLRPRRAALHPYGAARQLPAGPRSPHAPASPALQPLSTQSHGLQQPSCSSNVPDSSSSQPRVALCKLCIRCSESCRPVIAA
jgi:hypothetical protein